MYKKLLPCFLFILFFQIVKSQNEFITVWKPGLPSSLASLGIPYASNEQQIWFPGIGSNYSIYWEEIGYPSHHAAIQNITSDYNLLIDFGIAFNPNPSEATYRVKVSNGSGSFNQIQFRSPKIINGNQTIGPVGDHYKITNIEQWGNIKWLSMENAFSYCENMDITATDIPDLSTTTNLSRMFSSCKNLVGNPTINNWDTSNIIYLAGTFSECTAFNQPIGNWNTSNLTSTATAFMGARNFNQPLDNWNMSKVVTTASMFFDASEFNQPLNNWDMSSNLEMELMFQNALKFNQPLNNWNTSKVIEMNLMFANAKSFNQDLNNWNTGNAKKMNHMFFLADKFNGNISNWNVSNVINMAYMFNGAKSFNQNISGWNVSNVTTMFNMFNNAIAFNQNLGNWKLNSLQQANNILTNTALSCLNYDKTLSGWSQNPLIPSYINISSASPLTYSLAEAVTARDHLINYKGWIITGDTYNAECKSNLGTSEIKTDHKINIYPNPAINIIYVENSHADHYTLLDLSGRIILKGAQANGQIDVQGLTPGNYILQLHEKENTQNLKFIKK